MASRLNINEGNFPVTPQLVFGLVFGFATFNQCLLLVLSFALMREERADLAGLFAGLSAVLGVIVFGAAFAWQWFARWLRATDVIVFALSGLLAAADFIFLVRSRPELAAVAGLGATAAVAAWQARGVVRKWVAGKIRAREK